MSADQSSHPVLIVAPLGQDASAMARLLNERDICTRICEGLIECTREISPDIAALLLTEEALDLPALPKLMDALSTQPGWSALQVIVLTSVGNESRLVALRELLAASPGNVRVIERPMQTATLLNAVQVAIQSRHRQYQMRDVLDQKERLIRQRAQHADELAKALAERTDEVTLALHRLSQSQRMAAVGTLAAGLAHDMNNLLLPLGARVDALLVDSKASEDVRKELAVITALLDHLRQLSRNLSLFSQDPDHEGAIGRTEMARWFQQINKLIDASVGRNIRLKWEIADDLPEIAIAPHRLTQIIQNLVHNARDAVLSARERQPQVQPNNSKPDITVRARHNQNNTRTILIEVIDCGTGMSDEVAQHCLEPFFTTKDRPFMAGAPSGGSGLGLSLANQLVQHAGGMLQIKSEVGLGTTISLILPVSASPEREKPFVQFPLARKESDSNFPGLSSMKSKCLGAP